MKKLYPVIHCLDSLNTNKNIEVALKAGADGVFLIDMDKDNPRFLEITLIKAKEEFPDFFIGVNYLGVSLMNMINYRYYDAVWFDDIGYEARILNQIKALCNRIREVSETKIFGGYDFKYRKPVQSIIVATEELNPIVDVLTTSGIATGVAADLKKMQLIKSVAKKPVAIASGITTKNIKDFLPFVDCFLVNTGISKDFYQLDLTKTKELAIIIKEYNDRRYNLRPNN